jgi:hypothetical protein
MDEEIVCRLKALIRAAWPGEYEVKRRLHAVVTTPRVAVERHKMPRPLDREKIARSG